MSEIVIWPRREGNAKPCEADRYRNPAPQRFESWGAPRVMVLALPCCGNLERVPLRPSIVPLTRSISYVTGRALNVNSHGGEHLPALARWPQRSPCRAACRVPSRPKPVGSPTVIIVWLGSYLHAKRPPCMFGHYGLLLVGAVVLEDRWNWMKAPRSATLMSRIFSAASNRLIQ